MATDQTSERAAQAGLRIAVPRWLRGDRFAVAVFLEIRASISSARRWELAGYGGLLLTAAIMRLWDLGSRAIHHDESLHAFYSWDLSKLNGFNHLPMLHGPFQFEANALVFWVFGDSDYTARLLYAVMGTVLVVLPFFLRARIGRLGALLVSAMLAFSPAMFYFSRFARNDILMAVWTLGLIIAMWRYVDEGKNRYLYIGSGLLALAFGTKENAFILVAILGMFLFLVTIPELWALLRQGIGVTEPSERVAPGRLVRGLPALIGRGVDLTRVSRPGAFLVLLITLTLPHWSAAVSVLQDTPVLSWANLVLAASEGSTYVGAPSGGGLLIAAVVVVVLLGLSARWGTLWNWSIWWRSALIFYVVWVLIYTTFLTNPDGIGSGVWQAMGYWIVQQGEARGGQPWYYYFVITSIYEYLPLFFGVIAAVYFSRKNDTFRLFLVFWAVSTFLLYTLASEKMPWLMVSVALPLIVLTGTFLADLLKSIQWWRLIWGGGWLLVPAVPLFLVVLWRLTFFGTGDGDSPHLAIAIALAAALLAMVWLGVLVARRTGPGNFFAFAALPVAILLLVLTIRTASTAAYQNGDIPVEMIVYTQTTPQIPELVGKIGDLGETTGQQASIPVGIDSTSGFSWPWAWYFRDYPRALFPSYGGTQSAEVFDSPVLLIHSQNNQSSEQFLEDTYTPGEQIKHRWWFPEETYRGMTIGKFLGAFVDRDAWRTAMDYFLYRGGVRDRIGSEDAYIYFSLDLPELPSAE